MGRYLANGILTSISIKKRESFSFDIDKNFNLNKKIRDILYDMNRIIDISKYNLIEKEDEFVLKLKLDFVNRNIHDLLKEINDLTPCQDFFENFYDVSKTREIDFNDPDFKKKYPLLCTIENDRYTIKCNNKTAQEMSDFDDFDWIIQDEYLYHNVTVRGSIIVLWHDCNKYDGEYQVPMLEILNNMKRTYYHSYLSTSLIYEIFG